MAHARKKRDNAAQYFDVGVQGRRTGITVPENEKDVFGIENIDGVFSSPEKSPQKPTFRSAEKSDRTQGSTDMDVESVLINRQVLRSTKTTLPPPSSRSPVKTNLGSSPRRRSSVVRQSAPPPPRSATRTVVRKLDFQSEKPLENVKVLAEQSNGHRSPSSKPKSKEAPSAKSSPEKRRQENTKGSHVMEEEHDDDVAPGNNSVDLVQAGYEDYEDDMPMIVDDMSPPRFIAESEQPEDPLSSPASAKRKRGALSKELQYRPPSVELGSDARFGMLSPEQPRKREIASSPRGNGSSVNGYHAKELPFQYRPQLGGKRPPTVTKPEPEPAKKRGSKKKDTSKVSKEVRELNRQNELMPPPSSRSKKSTVRQSIEEFEPLEEDSGEDEDDYEPQPKKSKKSSRALAEKDANAKIRSKPSKSLWSQTSRKPGARTLQVLRENTPMEDSATVTRSGRRCVKPLEYWAGERAERDPDGNILQIVRAESVELEKPSRKGKGAGGQKRKPNKYVSMEMIEEDDAGNMEEWEENGEVQQGPVAVADPETGELDDEVDKQLAWGVYSVQTRDVANAHFKFGKYFNIPYLSAGILEFPVNGFKQVKHSGKMHLVFFVQYGKLEVTVHESVFNISSGGCWQVPSGNTYGIQNVGEGGARVFFAQGCPLDGDGEVN